MYSGKRSVMSLWMTDVIVSEQLSQPQQPVFFEACQQWLKTLPCRISSQRAIVWPSSSAWPHMARWSVGHICRGWWTKSAFISISKTACKFLINYTMLTKFMRLCWRWIVLLDTHSRRCAEPSCQSCYLRNLESAERERGRLLKLNTSPHAHNRIIRHAVFESCISWGQIFSQKSQKG